MVDGKEGFSVRGTEPPAGTIKDDPEFGDVEVYFQQVEILVRLNRPAGPEQRSNLLADFQGCRDGDICYPPDHRGSENAPGNAVDVDKALSVLTPRARQILELREYGYRYKEIADMIQTSEAAVKMQVKRAFERMRRLLVA